MSFRSLRRVLTCVEQTRLARILVHFPESECAEDLICFTVSLARQHHSRLRGLTLIDTTRFEELAATCESGAYALHELQRLKSSATRRDEVRKHFSFQCLAAGVDFELRQKEGSLPDVLLDETRFHDLAVTAVSSDSMTGTAGELSSRQLAEMVLKSAAPQLVLRRSSVSLERVLLIHDGSHSSSRAISSFSSARLFSDLTVRFLAVGPTAREARETLYESIDSIRNVFPHLESGYLVGKPSQVIPPYIRQWDAQLTVLGVQKTPPWKRLLFGETIANILQKTPCALYCTS